MCGQWDLLGRMLTGVKIHVLGTAAGRWLWTSDIVALQ